MVDAPQNSGKIRLGDRCRIVGGDAGPPADTAVDLTVTGAVQPSLQRAEPARPEGSGSRDAPPARVPPRPLGAAEVVVKGTRTVDRIEVGNPEVRKVALVSVETVDGKHAFDVEPQFLVPASQVRPRTKAQKIADAGGHQTSSTPPPGSGGTAAPPAPPNPRRVPQPPPHHEVDEVEDGGCVEEEIPAPPPPPPPQRGRRG